MGQLVRNSFVFWSEHLNLMPCKSNPSLREVYKRKCEKEKKHEYLLNRQIEIPLSTNLGNFR